MSGAEVTKLKGRKRRRRGRAGSDVGGSGGPGRRGAAMSSPRPLPPGPAPCPSPFLSSLDFCPDCGSVLPRPGPHSSFQCPRCALTLQAEALEGRSVRSCLEFNRPHVGRGLQDAPQSEGPMVERRCPRCGHEGMGYKTRQMRSADEGQTVFYTCPQCRFQEKEDS